jgi:quercetin dioxygenase-like cupin family protein
MRTVAALSTMLAAAGLVALSPGPSAAQYSERSLALANQYASGWENDRLRVRTVSIEPGARLDERDAADRVLVYLTADLEGRMPKAEAIWHPVDGPVLENRGRLRSTAIVIDVKSGPPMGAVAPPPEALSFTDDVATERLIDNAHVTVTRVRYRSNAYVEIPRHLHAQDTLIVYLRGGQAWPQLDGWGVPTRARRGDIDVIHANTFHGMTVAGSDPLEFLIIAPK